ncbi:PREDICTED: uncharacterized protein LOC107349531 [Acropora digitifera]|uniref:uncharacterized protein LOC107349531 n=1 Tax=Acropora digitifera TaxID=70779 RepID=UPI00077A74DA|nr:PREDICTED: uncharacterized protein LOC107349531 [Acropora digitifera]
MVDAADRTLLSVVSLFLLIPSKMVSGMEPRGDELVFTLEHCLTEGADASFLPRGTIFVKSLKSLSATFSQREPLSPSELDKLRDLASRNGHYRIRLQPKSGQDNSDVSDGSVTTVVKAVSTNAGILQYSISSFF